VHGPIKPAMSPDLDHGKAHPPTVQLVLFFFFSSVFLSVLFLLTLMLLRHEKYQISVAPVNPEILAQERDVGPADQHERRVSLLVVLRFFRSNSK
jgi:hypothetical protein